MSMPAYNYQLSGDQIPLNGGQPYSATDLVYLSNGSYARYSSWLLMRTTITILGAAYPLNTQSVPIPQINPFSPS